MKATFRSISPLFLFTALLVLFFPDIFFHGKVYIARTGDFHLANYSMSYFFKESVRSGVWPLWNPLSFSGYPFGAAALSNVNFTYLLALVSDNVNFAWNATILGSVFLAAAFTFFYLRKIGFETFPCILAAIIFAFTLSGGNFIDSWGFFLPLTLWMAEEYFSSRKARYAAVVVAAFALYFLNVLPQYALYAGVFFSLYVWIRFRSFAGIYLPALAFGMVSFYTFRLFEALQLSPRGHLWFMNVILPTHLVNMIFPWIFESPFRQETNFFFAKIFYQMTRSFFGADNILYLDPPYIGIIGFTFFVFSWKTKGIPRIYLGTALSILFYMMTFPFFSSLYRHIPILAQLPRIVRLECLFCFCLAVLAAAGAQRVLREKPAARALVYGYAGLAALVLGFFAAIQFATRHYGEVLRGRVLQYVENHIIGQPQYQAPPDFYRARVDEFFYFLAQWSHLASPSVLIPIVLMAAVSTLLVLWNTNRISRRLFSLLCGGLLILDLLIYFRSTQYTMTSPSELKISSPVSRYLEQDKEIFRAMPVLEPAEFGVGRVRSWMAANANLLYGIAGVEGWDAFLPRRYAEFFRTFQKKYDTDPALIMGGAEGDFDLKMMNFLNVKYFITRSDQVLKSGLPIVAEDDSHKLYLNQDYLPRAYFVYDFKVVSDKGMLEYLKNTPVEWGKTVVLNEPPAFSASPLLDRNAGHVTFRQYSPHVVEMQVETPAEGLLVLSDNDYPGWKATVDGQSVRILRANHSFRAVEVPGGQHTVRYDYRPQSFVNGKWTSLVFVLLGIILLGARRSIFPVRGKLPKTAQSNSSGAGRIRQVQTHG